MNKDHEACYGIKSKELFNALNKIHPADDTFGSAEKIWLPIDLKDIQKLDKTINFLEKNENLSLSELLESWQIAD